MHRTFVQRPELALVALARAGDERAFAQLAEPHRPALLRHCYRMLGSLLDAEDAVQDAFVHAWRGLPRFEPRAPFQAWLYRIATNVCLTALRRRPPHLEAKAASQGGAVDGVLTPYPDALLNVEADEASDPAHAFEARQGIEIAFLTAVRLLAPRQRAALILHDVLEWSVVATDASMPASRASTASFNAREPRSPAKEPPAIFHQTTPLHRAPSNANSQNVSSAHGAPTTFLHWCLSSLPT
jgi:RNA polymerase sigma-70 factor, ECF subfamily